MAIDDVNIITQESLDVTGLSFLHSVPVSSSLFDDSLHVCDVSQEQSDVQHALRHRLLRGIQVHVQIRG